MKKTLLLIASAALLLVGCAKEQVGPGAAGDGEMVDVTITAGTAALTKAAIDGDGAAANVTRWIMEVRDVSGEVYAYKAETENAGTLQHIFNIKLVKNQQYTFAFWADNGDVYYDASNLSAVKYKDGKSVIAGVDAKDAFSAVETLTFSQSMSKTITLYRPFAQLNVITNDLADLRADAISAAAYNDFKPKNFKATITVPTQFNVLTGAASGETELILSADAFYGKTPLSYEDAPAQATMFMAYIFATKDEKDIRNINFKFDVDSQTGNNTFDFEAVPFQRNYRTNILGNFLSGDATWTVTIDHEWDGEYLRGEQATATSIDEINDVLAQGASDVIVTAIAADDPDDTIYLPKSNEGKKNITITFPATTKDLKIEYKEGTETYCPDLNVKAETMSNIEINLPNSHVELLSGEFAAVKAATSISTIVVRGGVVIESLTVTEGAVKIYGTVNSVIVNKAEGKDVAFYNCYGISSDVKEAIAAYAGVGYVFEQVGEKWNLVTTEITPEGCEIEGHTAVVEPEATVVVIPEGVKEVVDENGNWPFANNDNVESIKFPSTASVGKVGEKDCQILGDVDYDNYAAFGNCDKLTDLILEGGCDMYFAGPLLPWGGAIKNIYIRKLPTSVGFIWGCKDNTEVNTILFYQYESSGQDYLSDEINIYLPAGWVAKGYQYKFSAANTLLLNETVPPVKVWEKNAQGEYVLLGTGTKCQGSNESIWTPAGQDEPGGDEPGGDEPGGDEPGGDEPGGDEPGGDEPGGDEPGGDEPGGDEPGGDEPGEQAQSKLPVTIDWTTASGCEVTGTSATISTTAEHVVIPEGATTMNSDQALDCNSTIKSLALPKSIPTFQPGFMGGCQNLTDLYIEGGGTITLPSGYPIFGGGLQNIYIEKLPDSAPMQGDQIYALIFDYGGQYAITSTSVNIYLPAGWKAKGYQYKFYCCPNIFGDTPTPVKVYEYNPESSKEDKYELLGTGTHTTNSVGVWNEAN